MRPRQTFLVQSCSWSVQGASRLQRKGAWLHNGTARCHRIRSAFRNSPIEISEALYARMATGKIDRLETVFSRWRPGHGIDIERRRLFPLDLTGFPNPRDANAPLLNFPSDMLLMELTASYLHAQLCNTALHAFAAENEARMEAMALAREQTERQLSALQATQRIVRQEEITAEIIELAARQTASRPTAPCRAL